MVNGTLDVSHAWRNVLLPTVAAWGELLRAGLTSGLCTDSQLLSLGPEGYNALVQRWPAMVTPPSASLTSDVVSALARCDLAHSEVV